MQNSDIRHDWSREEISNLFSLPFIKLLHLAMTIHQKYFVAATMQISNLLSLKTGACPEDCAYCAQSSRYQSEVKPHALLGIETIVAMAKTAKKNGVSRFCMGGAWRTPPTKQFEQLLEIIKAVKEIGLETCMSLGMLTILQARALKTAGLDFYNHNLDTSPVYYKKIISTRTYSDRIATLENLRCVGIKICCGGIVGMGEDASDRMLLLQQLANFPEHPHSVPINSFIPMLGTPLVHVAPIDPFDFVRVIAVARILMPRSFVRLAAGREGMSDELQALCFCAGANSIFCGDKLLTAKNPAIEKDYNLLHRLGIKAA